MSAFQTVGLSVLGLFEHLAESTWGSLHDARNLGLGFSEDTISDLAMLEIRRSGLSGIDVQRVSKRKERLVGFDWLWVISRPGHQSTIYVVQAKKIKLDRSQAYSYGRLRYPAGSKYQLDALEDFADWLGAVPLYCFYNSVDHDTALMYWNCRVQQPPSIHQIGCTLAPIDVVRLVHDGRGPKNFCSIHSSPEALPWRCLFHPDCIDFGLGDRSSWQPRTYGGPGEARALEFVSALTRDDGSSGRLQMGPNQSSVPNRLHPSFLGISGIGGLESGATPPTLANGSLTPASLSSALAQGDNDADR